MTGKQFDIVDLFIYELEEVIYDGMTAHRQQPFAHWISWILAQLGQNAHMDELQHSRTSFKEYSPHAPRNGRCGPRGQRLAQRTLDERAVAEGRVRDEERAAEDAALDKAKAQLPEFLAVDTDDSEDDEDFTLTISVPRAAHDDEAGTSRGSAPVPPPVTAAQVSQPDTLAALLQAVIEEQHS